MPKIDKKSDLTVGKQVKSFRKISGLTQMELAHNAGISLRYLQKIESNQSNAKIDSLDQIANALKTPSCFLINAFYSDVLHGLGFSCVKQILDKVPTAIYVCDIEGKLAYKNPAYQNLFGKNLGLESDYLWDNCATEEEKSFFQKKVIDILSSQKAQSGPIRTKMHTADGDIVETMFIWDYVRSSDKSLKGLTGALIPLNWSVTDHV